MKNNLIKTILISISFLQGMTGDSEAKTTSHKSALKAYTNCRAGDPDECYRVCGSTIPECIACVNDGNTTYSCSTNTKKSDRYDKVISEVPPNCTLQPPRMCREICAKEGSHYTVAPCATCTQENSTTLELLCGSKEIKEYSQAYSQQAQPDN